MANYFDGYQSKYPSSQISINEKDDRVFCIYNASFDSNGKELDRKIFRNDMNNILCDSIMLPNNYLVMAGMISEFDNPFNYKFTNGIYALASLFVYEL